MTDPTPGGPDSGTDAGGTGATDPIRYADALAELEAILDELDGDEVDVDVLGARVRRAAELLRLCRDRISAARFEVEQVVAELEAETAAPLAGASESPDHGEGDGNGDADPGG